MKPPTLRNAARELAYNQLERLAYQIGDSDGTAFYGDNDRDAVTSILTAYISQNKKGWSFWNGAQLNTLYRLMGDVKEHHENQEQREFAIKVRLYLQEFHQRVLDNKGPGSGFLKVN